MISRCCFIVMKREGDKEMTFEEFEKNMYRALDESEIDDLKALEELNNDWFEMIKRGIKG